MPSIPLIVVWFAVLSGYLPYSMGYAFLNPLILVGYGLLGWLLGANLSTIRPAIIGGALTTILAILTVNISSGIPHLVLPSTSILVCSLLLTISCVLATNALRNYFQSRHLPEERIQFFLRAAFAAAAVLLYLNGYLPYDVKMWIAAHTTNRDLIAFSLATSTILLTLSRFFSKAI
jgi:hypothetical protein